MCKADKVSFSIRPFGAGRVSVKLDFHGMCDSDDLRWSNANKLGTFHVEHGFEAFEEADGAWGRYDHTTISLPEALVLCERETENYQRCLSDAKRKQQRREQATDEAKAKRKNPTPAEALVAALERWHSSLPHETEE